MPRIVVATALYAMPQSWVSEFAAGLAREFTPNKAEMVVALDGIEEKSACEQLKSIIDCAPVHFVRASGSPIAVRLAMLDKVRRLSPNVAILIDADDIPMPEMFERHSKALAQADISFGDMQIIGLEDEKGVKFFDGADVPGEVRGSEPLTRTNFMGLTNTALGEKSLAESERLAQVEVLAFDWWLFTSLLERGCHAKRADGAVTFYRHRDDGTLGARPDPDPRRFARRCRIVAAHGRAFGNRPRLAQYGADAERAAEQIEREPEKFAPAIAAACAPRGLWFADVDRFLAKQAKS